jgi:hypothetical protein
MTNTPVYHNIMIIAAIKYLTNEALEVPLVQVIREEEERGKCKNENF